MIKRVFPFLDWLPDMNAANLRTDFISGLTVALILIPQSMAYAQLAGMPVHYGLYASLLPPMLAALFGSSRQLATGPVAIVSLMTSASLGAIATQGSEGFIGYAILLAFIVGSFQLALGLLRLGLVVNFLSHPVVNGFTNAGALIIATSQLSKIFNVYVDEAHHHYETVYRVIASAIHYTHWPTVGLGALAFAIMYFLKRLDKRIPNVLAAVTVTTLISWAVGYEHNVEVPLDSVASVEFRNQTRRLNELIRDVETISKNRAESASRMNAARETHGKYAAETLELEHRIRMATMRIDALKEEAGVIRAALRGYLMAGTRTADGQLVFYPKNGVPAGAETDGRTWRVRVGNRVLDENALPMMGGGAVVGVVPKGLPAVSAPKFDIRIILFLLPTAAIISLLGFMEAISIAKAMAAKTGQRLDPNQELIGQGTANIMGAFTQSFPVSGSFSRSAVNLQSGAVTGLSSVFTSMTIGVVLLFFTPLLYHLPQSVLAAVIMMAVSGLLNVSGFVHAWKAQRYDGVFSVVTFVCTLWTAPHLDKGIMIGVALSLGMFLYKSMRPKVTTLSMYPDNSYRSARDFGLEECRHIALVRFDGNLFYANAGYLEERITEITMRMPELKHIVIVGNGINEMDASGEEMLSLIVDRVRAAGYDLSLSGVNENVLSVMKRTHLYEKIGEKNFFPTMAQAVQAIHQRAHTQCGKETCPLISVCFIK